MIFQHSRMIFRYMKKKYKKVLLISQTTGNKNLFDLCVKEIKSYYKDLEIKIINSICSITSIRESDALQVQNKVDITFVIGDKTSSNANKLYKILKENNDNTFFIEDINDLKDMKINFSNIKNVQIVSSSSTPDFIEKEVINYISNE